MRASRYLAKPVEDTVRNGGSFVRPFIPTPLSKFLPARLPDLWLVHHRLNHYCVFSGFSPLVYSTACKVKTKGGQKKGALFSLVALV